MAFIKAKKIGNITGEIYGVVWDGITASVLTRTDDAVNFTAPNPYYGGNMSSTPSSPFDNISPWKDMIVSEDAEAGTLVAIPKFYYKLGYASGSTGLTVQISMTKHSGFSCSPAHKDRGDGKGERDVVYVGRYHSTSTYKSVTKKKPVTDFDVSQAQTRSIDRSGIHNLGNTIWQIDFLTLFTIWLLYLVEFANWDCQTNIGYGCGGGTSSNVVNTGYTDSMGYHTGTTKSDRTTYGIGTQYRNIEGLWDNVYDWLDGCYYNSNGLYIIENPSAFSDSSGGTLLGLPVGGYPASFTISNGLFYPATKTSAQTYTNDMWAYSDTNSCLAFGGTKSQSKQSGLFRIDPQKSNYSNNTTGCRLMKLP